MMTLGSRSAGTTKHEYPQLQRSSHDGRRDHGARHLSAHRAHLLACELNAPFFNPAHRYGFDAYAFIFEDSDFWSAFANSIVIAAGMVLIALPLGAALAFLLTRTDLPAQRWIEVMVLIPVFVSPMVLAFGYVVAMGPVGFYSLWAKSLFGDVPWNVYSLASIAAIAGLTHVPHVYLYSSVALKSSVRTSRRLPAWRAPTRSGSRST
jgi:ABC-type Fe3+ transport system permease subunit